ncbi:hypothetical protein Tco_0082239, partial [Tanacetum coccineum]
MTQRLTLKLEAWLCRYATLHAIYNLDFTRECRVPRSKDNINWNQGSSSKAVRIEDAPEKAMCAID